MGQFIEGVDRHQAMLLPECLEDYVGENSPVRAIDALINMLDLAGLGFQFSPARTGQPGYHPGLMLRNFTDIRTSSSHHGDWSANAVAIWNSFR